MRVRPFNKYPVTLIWRQADDDDRSVGSFRVSYATPSLLPGAQKSMNPADDDNDNWLHQRPASRSPQFINTNTEETEQPVEQLSHKRSISDAIARVDRDNSRTNGPPGPPQALEQGKEASEAGTRKSARARCQIEQVFG